jgi:RHS repeat-associated protein
VFLINVNGPGGADAIFTFGPSSNNPNWQPIAGDWDGQYGDSVGLYNPAAGVFYLRNSNSGGAAHETYSFGPNGSNNDALPVAGDWDGDGDDTIGVYIPSSGTFFLKNSHGQGTPDATFSFGPTGGGWLPVAGDWDGDGDDTIGIYSPSTGWWYLRNSNAAGGADVVFNYSTGGTPIAGDWNGTPNAGSNWQQTYSYDRWGNRTKLIHSDAGGTTVQNVAIETYEGKVTNRIANVNTTTVYDYDAAGNVISDGVYTYKYDGANRLRRVLVAGVDHAVYKYDAANRRVKQVIDTPAPNPDQVIYSLWEGMHVVGEYKEVGTSLVLDAEYVFLGDRMIRAERNGVSYVHPDRLSTRLLTSTSGDIAGTQAHRPFGEEDVTTGTVTDKHRFTNYERDSTGGDYAVNRQFASSQGRFFQVDPIPGSVGNPQSFNAFAYSLNDPVNLIDPLGLDEEYGPPHPPITLHSEPGGPPRTGGGGFLGYTGLRNLLAHGGGLLFVINPGGGSSKDPCAGKRARKHQEPIILDYHTPRSYAEDSTSRNAFEHIPKYHMVFSGSKSTYLTPPGDFWVKFQHVLKLNQATIANAYRAKQLSTNRFAYIYAFESKDKTFEAGAVSVTLLPDVGIWDGQYTNTNTVIVDGDCNVVTSFPGLPQGVSRYDSEYIFGHGVQLRN